MRETEVVVSEDRLHALSIVGYIGESLLVLSQPVKLVVNSKDLVVVSLSELPASPIFSIINIKSRAAHVAKFLLDDGMHEFEVLVEDDCEWQISFSHRAIVEWILIETALAKRRRIFGWSFL